MCSKIVANEVVKNECISFYLRDDIDESWRTVYQYLTLLVSKNSKDVIIPSHLWFTKYRKEWAVGIAWWRHQMETFSALLAFMRGIHRSPVNSPHKDQWHGALMFSLVCVWTNGWTNPRDAGDLWRHLTHYGDNVMERKCSLKQCTYVYATSAHGNAWKWYFMISNS